MNHDDEPPIGIPWYRLEAYTTALQLMEDAADLPPSFPRWLQAVEAEIKAHETAGRRTVRALIDPLAFPHWCKRNGFRLNAAGRKAYADAVAKSLPKT